jgi:hypothetical protein
MDDAGDGGHGETGGRSGPPARDGAEAGGVADSAASTETSTGGDGRATSADPAVDVGVLVAHSPGGDPGALGAFAERIVGDAADELREASDAPWRVHGAKPDPVADRAPRRPSEFLDEAALHMAERPYDLVVVVTDVPVTNRTERSVPGLASPVARVVVVSTHRLRRPSGGEAARTLDAEAVRWNGATLVAHLLGHVLGADHGDGGVMAPFAYDPSRSGVPSFDADVRTHLRHLARRAPQESVSRGRVRRLVFHVRSLLHNPGTVASTLLHSRAPLIPLSLPRLSTAAVTPTLILVFSAEAWDVGLNLSNGTAALFAAGSIVAAAVHLLYVQRLSVPRERSHVITEHMALVNVTVFGVLLLAMVGLFTLVGAIMLLVELAVFPPNLMTNWPSLEDPSVGLVDLVRVGGFISTLGVLSGALAGGIENRMALRHLALFLDRP